MQELFFGRENDLNLLEEKWNSNRFELGLLYRSRRIGKTTLVNKFLENKNYLYFQAKEASELENRRSLSKIINKKLDNPISFVYPDWDELLEAIIKAANKERFAFVIDEYPYLAKATKKGIASYFQDFIDNKAKNTQLYIILMGSNVSLMENEVANKKTPLYRRRTFAHKLCQMSFSEPLLFLRDFTDVDKFNCLSFFGFSPYYLALLNPKKSFEQNVKSLIFSQGATLLDAPDIILSNGTREKGIYNTILLSLARGRKTPTEIANDIEMEANEVSKYLKTLTEEEIVTKQIMFNSQRKIIYRISDNVLEFFYKYLSDDVERIRIGFGSDVFEEKSESIHDFICRKFESTCLHFMEEQSLLGLLSHPYYPITNLTIDNSELGRSIELDGISQYQKSLLVIECKYREGKRGINDYLDMKNDVSIKMFSQIENKEFYLFSKSGFDTKLKEIKDDNLHIIDIKMML